ncbi:MAG TPA: ABC transporter substrate-binding protein [Planctomycetota bacterium]|nr:ABC transporter substrate-binding protein [Planctomycetota bacterium]
MKTPHLIAALLASVFILAFYYDQPPRREQTPEKITITYWEKWTGFEGEAMKATIDVFNRKKIKNKKGQVIFCKCLSVTQVDRKSALAIAGGQPPDICGFWEFNTHSFADMGALRPLDDLIERDKDKIDASKYIPVFWEMCKHRGKMWCLPTTPAAVALHWNKDMFREAGLDPEKPPRSIQELEEFAEKLTKKDKDGRIIQMGFLPPEPGWWHWSWGYFFGGKLNDGLEKLTANDPKNIEAFKWVAKFAEKYGREDMLAFQQGFGSFDSPQNAFLSGRVAMVLQGVWMANFIRFHRPAMKWGCGPFPSNFDDGGHPVSIGDMDVITIPRGAKHVDEAWEVIKFINSPEGMEYLCGKAEDPTTGEMNNGGQGKLTPFLQDRPGFIERHPHPFLKVFIDLAKSKNCVPPPKVAVWDEYQKEMTNVFELVWLNKMSAEEALNAAQNRLQPKLDQILKIQKLREDEWK